MTSIADSNSPPTIDVSDKVTTEEAAKILDCSVSSVNNLRKDRKLTSGQMVDGQWFYDLSELHKAKASRIITPRKRRDHTRFSAPIAPTNKGARPRDVDATINFTIPNDKFERIKLALAASNKTPEQFVRDTLDALDCKIIDKLSGIV